MAQFPTNWYWIINDSSPSTQVWSNDLGNSPGSFVANNNAGFLAWLAAVSTPDFQSFCNIASAASNGAGGTRFTLTSAIAVAGGFTWTSGAMCYFSGTGGLYDGAQAITIIDGLHIDIAVAFAGTCVGFIGSATIVDTKSNLLLRVDSYNRSLLPTLSFSSSISYFIHNTTVQAGNPPLPSTVFLVPDTGISGSLQLPSAQLFGFWPKGLPIYFENIGTQPVHLLGGAGGTLGSLQPGDWLLMILTGNTTGDGSWAQATLPANPVPVGDGGTGASSLTTHGVLLGEGTAAIQATAAMTDGQLLVGQSGANPLPKTITGDVTFTAAGVSALGNIPNDTTMAGDVLATNVAAPATPAAGKSRIYVDSTAKNLTVKNDAGAIFVASAPTTGINSRYFSALTAAGVFTQSQPASTDLADLPIPVASGGTGDTGTAWSSFTSTITAGTGTFTTVSATSAYKQLGKMVFVRIQINITTNGTAASFISATLPVAEKTATTQCLAGRGNGGIALTVAFNAGAAIITKYDGTYFGANGAVVDVQGVYEAA